METREILCFFDNLIQKGHYIFEETWTSIRCCTGIIPRAGLSYWSPNLQQIKCCLSVPSEVCFVLWKKPPHHHHHHSDKKGNRSGRACTAAHYLSLILAPDFTAGMQRWDQSLSVFNEHGMVTVLKTTRPRNRGLGCTNRYSKMCTKTALFSSYLTVK